MERESCEENAGCVWVRAGQQMCVWPNAEVCWGNPCCSGKAMSNTYCECVCVAFGIQCIYVFCVDSRVKSDYFPIQH
jgi:hypothetical protein